MNDTKRMMLLFGAPAALLLLIVAGVIVFFTVYEESPEEQTGQDIPVDEDTENNGSGTVGRIDLNIQGIENYHPDGSAVDWQPHASLEDGEVLYVGYGSSTCPPAVDEAIYDSEENAVQLYIEKHHENSDIVACTMDMVPTAQRIYHEDLEIPGDASVFTDVDGELRDFRETNGDTEISEDDSSSSLNNQ